MHRRDEDDVGIALAETAAKERFLASSNDPVATTGMIEHSPIGRTIDVVTEHGRHGFSFQQG